LVNKRTIIKIIFVLTIVLSLYLIWQEYDRNIVRWNGKTLVISKEAYSKRVGFKIKFSEKYFQSIMEIPYQYKESLNDLDKFYEVVLKKYNNFGSCQSLLDDVLINKAKIFINYNGRGTTDLAKAAEILDTVMKDFKNDTIMFPRGISTMTGSSGGRAYITTFTSDTFDYCTVLKTYIYYINGDIAKCQKNLEEFIFNKLLTSTYSEDIEVDFWNHEYFAGRHSTGEKGDMATRAMSSFRPDKIALIMLMKIYLTQNNFSKFYEAKQVMEKCFPKFCLWYKPYKEAIDAVNINENENFNSYVKEAMDFYFNNN